MKQYVFYTIKIFLVSFFIVPGLMNISDQPSIINAFNRFGYEDSFRYFIGLCEILGALGIVIGAYINRWLPILAGIGLSIIMLGAIYSHFIVSDPLLKIIPSTTSILLLTLYLKLEYNFSFDRSVTQND